MRELPSRDEPFFSIVFTGVRTPPVWSWPTFNAAAAALTRLTELAATPTAVRSVQSSGPRGKQCRFGRLAFSPTTHSRWVQDAPGEETGAEARVFYSTEIWAPGWAHCHREDGAPFVFIAIDNPHILARSRDGQFNQLVHVALPVALVRHHREIVNGALAEIAAAIESVQRVYRLAPWWHHGDSVQDALNNHFNYVGRHQDDLPELRKMRTSWLPFAGELSEAAT